MEEPPPLSRKMTREDDPRDVRDLRMASAARMDSELGTGWPPKK
jgi:hypothetical protein